MAVSLASRRTAGLVEGWCVDGAGGGEVGGIGGVDRACACYRRTGGRDPVVGRRNGGVGVLCVVRCLGCLDSNTA